MISFDRLKFSLALLILLVVYSGEAFAGFLEMPDTTEVPEMERESLLKDMDIPPVRDRDPDPMSGPRLNITEFRVQGIVEYPELGITRQSLMRLVEGIRFDLMAEGQMLESGYTLEEVSEISDLIAQIEDETEGQRVTPLDVQRLVFLIREQRQRRGVTLGMIEAVADTITRYYRERGFILAKAYIPQQRVRDGVVTLTLLLGNLGEVKVHNNGHYSAKTISKIFRRDLNKPVKADLIEESLFFVNDLPGLSAQAFFEPGAQVGDTRLSINVLEEDVFTSNVRIDNHGSESTGEYRIYADASAANLAGFGDQLHVGFLATVNPSDSLYGSIHYGFPLFSQRAKWSIGGSTNDFVTNSLTGLSLSGKSEVLDSSLNYILKRSRVKNYSFELKASHVETDVERYKKSEVDEGETLTSGLTVEDYINKNDSEVTNYDIAFNFDILLEKLRALHQGSVKLTFAELIHGVGAEGKRNHYILNAQYSFLKFMKVPFSNVNSRMVIKASGQYLEDFAPSINQFSIAGPNKVRALPINLFNGDTGFYISADWMFDLPKSFDAKIFGVPLRDILQPYIFSEFAYADTDPYSEGVEEAKAQWAGVSDIGLGLKASFKNNFRLGFSYGKVLNYRQDDGTSDLVHEQDLEQDDNFYFDMQYSF